MSFEYTNRSPNPWGIISTNTIKIWINRRKNIVYSRQYHGNKRLSTPINIEMCGDSSPEKVAKLIHWGCCGWAAGGHEINNLINRVKEEMEHMEIENLEEIRRSGIDEAKFIILPSTPSDYS